MRLQEAKIQRRNRQALSRPGPTSMVLTVQLFLPSLPHHVFPNKVIPQRGPWGEGAPERSPQTHPLSRRPLSPWPSRSSLEPRRESKGRGLVSCHRLRVLVPLALPVCLPEESSWTGGSEPRNSLKQLAGSQPGQSCHHNSHFCLGQGPGTANVHSSIPHTSKVSN